MYYDRKHITWVSLKIGILVTGGVFIVIFTTLFATDIEKRFTGKNVTIYAVFENVKGLTDGAPIRFSGVQIGSVKGIHIRSDGKIKVAMPIVKDMFRFLKKDSRAGILTLGLLGDKYISIAPGSEQADRLEPGDAIQGEVPVELQDIVATTQKSLNRMGQFIQKLEAVVDGTDTDKEKGTIGKLFSDPEVYDNIKAVTNKLSIALSNINAGKGTLGKIITEDVLYADLSTAARDIRHFTESLRKSKGSLHRFIKDPRLYQRLLDASDSLSQFSQKLLTSKGTINRLIEDEGIYENFNMLSKRLNIIFGRIEKGEGLLGQMTKDDQLVDEIKTTLKEFKLLLTDIRKDPKRYLSFSVFGLKKS
jgi:phospholipid/cholesterol/gamma-HCH transport system substrate-binding protein